MNKELFQKQFKFEKPSVMLKEFFRTNNNRKNKGLVNLIKSRLTDLKDEIGEMAENEIEIEKPDKMVNIVERIREFNTPNQEGKVFKILTA